MKVSIYESLPSGQFHTCILLLTVDYDVYFVLTMYNTISFVSFKIKFQNVELLTFIVLCTVASSFYTL